MSADRPIHLLSVSTPNTSVSIHVTQRSWHVIRGIHTDVTPFERSNLPVCRFPIAAYSFLC